MTLDPAAPATPGALAALVGDPATFARDHWAAAPLLHRAADRASSTLVPLDVDDVDRLLNGGLRWPGFRLVREGRTVPAAACTRSGRIGGQRVDDLADAPRVLDLVADGATLVLQGLHRTHAPVARLCAGLERDLGHPVQANAYLTPPDARGLSVHHDTHDVFALQTHGHKHWVVHEPAVVAPLAHQPWRSGEHEPGPRTMDLRLDPGDVLYLPRGTPHAAETVEGVSLHLTIGVRAVTWFDVVQRAARELGEQETLRASLPIRYADDAEALGVQIARHLEEAATVMRKLDASALAGTLVEERRGARARDHRGWLRSLVELDHLDDDTIVVRPTDVEATVHVLDDRAEVVLPDRSLRLPVAAAPVVALLLDGREHRLGEVADHLDADSRRVLTRRLVREGALRVRDAARG